MKKHLSTFLIFLCGFTAGAVGFYLLNYPRDFFFRQSSVSWASLAGEALARMEYLEGKTLKPMVAELHEIGTDASDSDPAGSGISSSETSRTLPYYNKLGKPAAEAFVREYNRVVAN